MNATRLGDHSKDSSAHAECHSSSSGRSGENKEVKLRRTPNPLVGDSKPSSATSVTESL